MLRRLRKRQVAVLAACAAALGLLAGCSGLLGFGDYSVETSVDSGPDASNVDANLDTTSDGGGEAEASCNVDLKLQCYACTPVTTEQFLNACSDGTCVPFDQNRLKGFLAADGGLPPLPVDGG